MTTEDSSFIGQRVRHYRKARGLSQHDLGEAVGKDRTYINHIEAGRRPVATRELLYALCQALSVRVTDLTGQPYDATDRAQHAVESSLVQIEHALMAAGTEPGPDLAPIGELEAAAALACIRRMHGDYAQLGAAAPQIITALHIHAAAGHEPERVSAALTRVLVAVAIGLKELGFTTLAYLAAAQAAQAALRPADRAAAAYAQSQVLLACAAIEKAAAVATGALEAAPTGGASDAMQMHGMLHLQAALCHTAIARRRGAASPRSLDTATAHRAEAGTLAAHTGEGSAYALRFGPTNVRVWELSLAIERDEPGRVAALAPSVDPGELNTPNRLARFYLEQARAHARRKNHRDALEMILNAETAAPAYVRTRPIVKELTGHMLRDARRRATSSSLVALAGRIGAA